MSIDEIISMAREAGFLVVTANLGGGYAQHHQLTALRISNASPPSSQPEAELRDQHKSFAEWFLRQSQVALSPEDLAWAAWKAALAQPETKAEPVAWAVMCDGNAVQTFLTETAANLIAENRREQTRGRGFDWQTTPLYAHPPRDEWREAVHDELVTTWTLSAENKDDPRKALQDIINWHVRVSLDPAVSSDAQALIERGKAMRDVTPPMPEAKP